MPGIELVTTRCPELLTMRTADMSDWALEHQLGIRNTWTNLLPLLEKLAPEDIALVQEDASIVTLDQHPFWDNTTYPDLFITSMGTDV